MSLTFTLPDRDRLTLAVPRQGEGCSAFSGLPLAGSRHLWWSDALCSEGADQTRREAAGLSAGLRAALSAPRPALCGLSLDQPRIMGILNVTPDSFSDGGRHLAIEAAVARALEMVSEGIDLIDIGGESTRPGAADVETGEEIRRTAPVIRALREAGITLPLSIDTRKAAVAGAALEAGADIINDVTALRYDPDMARLAAESKAPVILMHSVADPQTMQAHARYDNVLAEVRSHLYDQVRAALDAGIAPEKLVLDPGIGFGKTTEHDLNLLRNLSAFHDFGLPVLLGASRKKFIGAISGASLPAERRAGSLAVALQGAAAGAQILRVHDTKETRQALSLWQAMAGEHGAVYQSEASLPALPAAAKTHRG